MRIRRIAVLIDGAFFLKRLPKIVDERYRNTPEAVANTARFLCKRHVQKLINEESDAKPSVWLEHAYRFFYYDAVPFDGVPHHPIQNRRVAFDKTPQAAFRVELFNALRHKRKFALRLGKVVKESDWRISPRLTKRLLKAGERIAALEKYLQRQQGRAPVFLSDEAIAACGELIAGWPNFGIRDVSLGLRQKGVDMRIGLDIASIALKKQADTIVLVSGDSDFVPAAKLARREGVEFILDPMWQKISDDLFEHIDGLFSPLRSTDAAGAGADDDG